MKIHLPISTNKNKGKISFSTSDGASLTEIMKINSNGNINLSTSSMIILYK